MCAGIGILRRQKKNGEGICLHRSEKGADGSRLLSYRIILIDDTVDVVANVRE